jgi:two-component system OmpR family response regulator
MDIVRRRVERAGEVIELLPKEFELLELLMRNEGRVVTRTMLLERVWGFHFDPKTSVVETHISRLRAKIDRPFGAPLLHTVRNVGYSLHASH